MCIVCGNNCFKRTLFGGYTCKDGKYRIVRCRKCGFMFLDPVPAQEVLDRIYQDNGYFSEYYIRGSGRLGYLEGGHLDAPSHKRAAAIIKKSKASGRLLDIGCAGGGFLLQAKKAGFDVSGVEPNAHMAQEARKNTAARVICGNFGAGMFEDSSFDVVRLGDVFEHMPEPSASLRAIKRILKDDGILVIEQPLTYNNSLFNLFLLAHMLLKKEKLSGSPPAHLWEFDPRTLRRFLRRNGFTVSFSRVFENKAKPLFVYRDQKWTNNISRWIKNASAFVSNFPLLRPLELGDRMILVCSKAASSGRPRVLFVHPDLNVGGAEQNRLSVLRHINKDKYDITLCCLSARGPIAEEIEALGFPVDCLKVSARSFNLLATLSLYTYIKKGGFSLVHTCLSGANLHGRIAARLAGVAVIISEEQSEYERYNPRLGFVFRGLNRSLAGFTDRIITCSGRTKTAICDEEKIPPEKFLVLHNVIDKEKMDPVKDRALLLREFGLSDKDKVIGYVATLAVRKGHIHLLRAFKSLSIDKSLKLVLVGDGPLRKELEKWTDDNGLGSRVIFTGQRRDVADMLSIFHVFVSPAMSEAFGIVLAEAMYMRLPCVAFSVGGIPEVVEDGFTGVLVQPGDADALAMAVKRLLDDPELAGRYGRNGRKCAEERFCADKYALELEKLYDSLLIDQVDFD